MTVRTKIVLSLVFGVCATGMAAGMVSSGKSEPRDAVVTPELRDRLGELQAGISMVNKPNMESGVASEAAMLIGQRILQVVQENPDDEYAQGPDQARTLAVHLFGMQLRPDQSRQLLDGMKSSINGHIRRLADGRERLLKWQSEPIDLSFSTPGGAEFRMNELRGKVVLLDVWSVRCSSCVDALPKIRALHEKYREHGMEVVNVCLIHDSKTETTRTLKIMADNQIQWPTWILKDEAAKQFWNTYGLIGEPATWVFDREGRLVSTRSLYGAIMENELRRHLGITG